MKAKRQCSGLVYDANGGWEKHRRCTRNGAASDVWDEERLDYLKSFVEEAKK